MVFIRLESFNFPQFFIRHSNFEGELQKQDSPGFADDFIFDEVFAGRDDSDNVPLVFFRSKNQPKMFLRHKDFRIVLEPNDGSDQFDRDAIFRKLGGLAGDPDLGFRSYEATNFKGHFIRHRNFHVFMDDKEPNLKEDATFKRDKIAQQIDDNP